MQLIGNSSARNNAEIRKGCHGISYDVWEESLNDGYQQEGNKTEGGNERK